MPVYGSILPHHELLLLVLSALVCAAGSWVTAKIYRSSRTKRGGDALAWLSLTAVTAGVSIWGTHFIAMLGHVPGVAVSFDLYLTFISLSVAVIGAFLGFLLAGRAAFSLAPVLGGVVLGGAIAAMHYVGMVAYEVDGVIAWDETYVLASIVCALVLTPLATYFGNRRGHANEVGMAVAIAASIIATHFIGMAAFDVKPEAGITVVPDRGNLQTIALATGVAVLLVVFGAFFTYIAESRARLESIAELKAARNAAEEASRAKSEFLSVLSHELRTPLTIILGYSRILTEIKQVHPITYPSSADNSGAHAEKIVRHAELYGQKIGVAADHLLGLINEILDYTRLELANPQLDKSSFSLGDLFGEVVEQFQDMARAKGAALTIDTAEIVAFADRGRIMQILINLLGNALKFSGAGTISLEARVNEAGLAISVADDGKGIHPDDLDRVFEAFQQLDAPDGRAEDGAGLGLAICKKLAQAHKGTISVESAPGAGTTFTVQLPSEALAQEDAREVA